MSATFFIGPTVLDLADYRIKELVHSHVSGEVWWTK